MTTADRLTQWNRWYDGTPEHLRSHIVLWPLVLAGFLNMQLSIAGGFPFGLLVLLAIVAMAAVRLPYTLGWIKPGEGGARLEVGRIDWVCDINQRYDALPEDTRFWVLPAILIVAGTLSMWLTGAHGWAFGSLFLIVVLALIALRAPYQWHMITPPPEGITKGPILVSWAYDVNRWYDGLGQERRFWTVLVGLGVVCAFDLWLVSGHGVSLFVLFVLELIALALIRAPYVTGALSLAPRGTGLTLEKQEPARIQQQHLTMLPATSDPVAASAPAAEPHHA
jgi:hypothetical protein